MTLATALKLSTNNPMLALQRLLRHGWEPAGELPAWAPPGALTYWRRGQEEALLVRWRGFFLVTIEEDLHHVQG